MSGPQLDRLAELRKGARGVPRPPERRAEVIARVEEPRIDRDRASEPGDRVLGASLLAAHEGEAVVDLGPTRRGHERGLVLARRSVEVPLLLMHPPQHV